MNQVPPTVPQDNPIYQMTVYHRDVVINGTKGTAQVMLFQEVTPDGMPDLFKPPIYRGQGLAMLQMQTPQGQQVVPHQFVFDILDCINVADAFARFPVAQEKGLAVELHKLKVAALRQGGRIDEMPQEHRKHR